MKAIIIDDEPLAREMVKQYLQKHPVIQLVTECNDGFEGIKSIAEHLPDLIFLDVQMPKINGFEMLELLDHKPAVIFVTAFEEYAIKAFDKDAIDYLLKPYSQERFDKAVWKAMEASRNGTNTPLEKLQQLKYPGEVLQRVVVKTGTKVKIIPVHEIEYIQAEDDFVKISTHEGSFLKNQTMKFYEDNLDKNTFVRIHRSYTVHVNQVTRIDRSGKENHLAILRNGKELPVSKSGYVRLKEVLGL